MHKKGFRKAFSVNLERQIFETKQTTVPPKKILDTALMKPCIKVLYIVCEQGADLNFLSMLSTLQDCNY